MNLSPPSPADLRAIDAASTALAESYNAAAHALNRMYERFWEGGPDAVVTRLNLIGAANVAQASTLHNQHATTINSMLDDALDGKSDATKARLSARAVTTPAYAIALPGDDETGKQIRMTLAGVFEAIPQPAPES